VPHIERRARLGRYIDTIEEYMTRYSRKLFAVLLWALSLMSAHAQTQALPPDPDAFVTAFYRWFFQHDNDQTAPLREPAIADFVAARTVERLNDEYARSGPPHGVDYFTKVQDYDPRDWAANIATQPAVVLGDVTVVPVTFGSADKTSVLVFLRNDAGRWKITKVDDTWDYN